MPTIQLDHCIKCMKCVRDCPSDAIDIENGTINDSCIHCGHCVAICPESTVYPDTGEIKKLHPPTLSPTNFQDLSAGIRTCRSYQDREVIEIINHQSANLLIKTLRFITSPLLMPILQLLAPKVGVGRLNSYKKMFIALQTPESSQVCHHAPVVLLFHAPVTRSLQHCSSVIQR